MKIGICGGTFDPFHRGHLDPILAVRGHLQWDALYYVPAYVQPFKTAQETVSPYHRFAMAVLATEAHEEMYVTPRELERGEVSYTVDTLRELRAAHPQATLDWIIGDDNLARLLEWKSIDTIFELANFVVLVREHRDDLPGSLQPRHLADARSRSTHGSIVFAENRAVPVSSTEIRKRVRAGAPIDDLVPAPVSRYIHHNGLYRKGQS
jgi:nicotinate-nucleotide adenylyltransferase